MPDDEADYGPRVKRLLFGHPIAKGNGVFFELETHGGDRVPLHISHNDLIPLLRKLAELRDRAKVARYDGKPPPKQPVTQMWQAEGVRGAWSTDGQKFTVQFSTRKNAMVLVALTSAILKRLHTVLASAMEGPSSPKKP